MSVSLMGFNFPMNIRTWKIAAALKMAGISYNFVELEFGVDNETADYKNNCSPIGRAPALQTEDGYIFESNAIMRHIARSDKTNSFLYGRTTFEAAQVDQWLDYCSEFESAAHYFVMIGAFGAPATDDETKKQLCAAHEAFTGLEKWLETRTFLAGERITIADLAIASAMDWILRYSGAAQHDFTKKYKNSIRHYNTVMHHPKFVEALTQHKGLIGLPKPEAEKKEKK